MSIRLMIDLETIGVSPGCSILSIGAAEFSPAGVGASYYGVVYRQSCLDVGLREEPATLAWWDRQEGDALDVIDEADDPAKSLPVGDALAAFSFWFKQFEGEPLVWGNGADFDLPILSEAYRRTGHVVPWKPYNGRCYRTLKNLRPKCGMLRSGVKHNALADAKNQAEHAVRLLNELGGW